jgi:hypothetical protein
MVRIRFPPALSPLRTSFSELHLDEVEIVLKRGEVVAGPIDLAQRERALVRH